MWRVAGDALNDGAPIDLDGLPPGFGGGPARCRCSTRSEARQFVEWKRLGGGAALTTPKKPLTAFPIDWATIDRRRRADLQKLDAMQQYAYTKGCRRGFVLRYFGDPAARTSCGGCDNCLGTRVEVEQGAAPARAERRHAASERRRASRDDAQRDRRRGADAVRRGRGAARAAPRSAPHDFARGAGARLRRVSRIARSPRWPFVARRHAARSARSAALVRRSSRSTASVFSPSSGRRRNRSRVDASTQHDSLAPSA